MKAYFMSSSPINPSSSKKLDFSKTYDKVGLVFFFHIIEKLSFFLQIPYNHLFTLHRCNNKGVN